MYRILDKLFIRLAHLKRMILFKFENNYESLNPENYPKQDLTIDKFTYILAF